MRATIVSLACGFALAACTSETTTQQASTVGIGEDVIPVSRAAGPGPNFMSAYDAGVIFADVCLTRGAKFENAVEGLAGFDFTQNATTGTYYHNTANLSVKVRSAECSMVYITDANVDSVITGLARGTASIIPRPPAGIDITSNAYLGGARAFRLGIKS